MLLKMKSFITKAIMPNAIIAREERTRVHRSTSRCPRNDISACLSAILNYEKVLNDPFFKQIVEVHHANVLAVFGDQDLGDVVVFHNVQGLNGHGL